MLSYPAARLFAERAAAAGHRADITDDDAEVLAEICSKLDGIALAIELAAVRVGAHGLREIATLLDGRLKLEWRGRRTAPPRQQTLGATLDWSYGLISESERIALRRLAVFAGPFTLQGAAAVAGEEDEPIERIVETLEQLVAKSLVVGAAGRRLDALSPAGYHQGLCDAEARRQRRSEGRRAPARRATFSMRSRRPWPSRAAAIRHPVRRSADELLADARAALNWAYANDDGADLRVPLAGACARLFVELNLLNEGRLWASRALAALDDTSRGSAMGARAAVGARTCVHVYGAQQRAGRERASAWPGDRRSSGRRLQSSSGCWRG